MSSDNEFVYTVKVLELKNLEHEKKKTGSIIIKCKYPGASLKQHSGAMDFGNGTIKPSDENGTFTFRLSEAQVSSAKSNASQGIHIHVMMKGHIKSDELGSAVMPLKDFAIATPAEKRVLLTKVKGSGEIHCALTLSGSGAAASDAAVEEELKRKYTFGAEVGRGGFSVVYEGTSTAASGHEGRRVAIKVIDKLKQSEEQLKILQREIDIMRRLKHPNIVGLYDVFETKSTISLVMELVAGGELYEQIVEKGSFTEDDAAAVLYQVLSATAYLHENGIAHRDLKPENILLSNQASNTVKIADFGLSKDFTGDSVMSTCCGSPSYVAPEILEQGEYSNACDIWSIGVILYVLLSGYLPFYGNTQEELFDKILTASFSFNNKCWDDVSEQAKDLVSRMLTLKPEDRPSAEECLKHPWFSVTKCMKPLYSVKSLLDLKKGIQ